jgi:PAS domain S-box-containing protein
MDVARDASTASNAGVRVMRLSTQLALAIVGVVLVATTALGLYTYHSVEAAILPGQLERAEMHTQLLAEEIETAVRAARADVTGFHSTAIEGIVRTALAGGLDPRDGTTLDQWRAQLASRFAAELAAKPVYTQFRVIGITDGGREIVRVDRSGPHGAIRNVPDGELQRKADSYYFKQAIDLLPGAVYASPIDLYREHGVIEVPHVPTMRVATPIQASNGRPFGILIINLDLRPVFDLVRAAMDDSRRIYVVNDRGDFLVAPDRNREFGFEFDKPSRWQNEFPKFATVLGSATEGIGVIRDVMGNRVSAAMSSVQLAAGPRIGVIETIPFSALVAPAAAAERSSIIVGFLAVLGALLLATVAARSLAKPLVQMTAAAEGYSRGEAMTLPTQSAGEIGVLARAFARMLREVRDKTAALENEFEEHKRTEAELEKHADRERLYGAAVQYSVDAVVTKTLDGFITGWNPAAERLFGFTAVEAIGQHINIIVPEDRQEELRGILARIRCGELVEHQETVRRAKSGAPIEVSLSISPIKLPSGEIVGDCKIAHDITEQKAAEEKFKLAVEACPNGMLMADRAGCIVMVNTAIETLFGYERSELVGQSIETLVPEHFRTRHFEDRRNYTAKPVARRMEAKQDLVGRRKDGTEFPVEIGLNPIQTRRGILILSVIVDMTERKRLDRLKEAFVSTVSHELRTPLTSICGSLGLLMGTAAKDLPERTVRLLSLAQANSLRLVQLVNDILDIEKLEAGQVVFKFKVVELRPLIDQVIDANRGYADTYLVRLRPDFQADEQVWADPDRLSQIVTNLLSNAIKFSRPDGEVVVAVERRGDGLRLSVRDHGDGIPAEFKSRIFEKFAQTDSTNTKKTGGTGLGLSIVKEIVTRLGGAVGFADAPGGGSVFYVDLPCVEEPAVNQRLPQAAPVGVQSA